MKQDVQLTLIDATYAITCGYEQATTTTSDVYGVKRSVQRNDFYLASQAGYRADAIFDMWSFEYGGQEMLKAEDITYDIIRTYQKTPDIIELTCQRREEK